METAATRFGLRLGVPSSACPGLFVVEGHFSDNALDNLQIYAREHLAEGARRSFEAAVDAVRQGIADGREVHVELGRLGTIVPADHRTTVAALARDVDVHLLRRRGAVLQLLVSPFVELATLRQIYKTHCMCTAEALDPDMPKAAAQVVARHCPQVTLLQWLDAELETALAELRGGEAGARLGAVIRFLRWVPHVWAEEMLLEIPSQLPRLDGICLRRVYISILRALSCRPALEEKTLERLFGEMSADFGESVPAETLPTLRACLLKGGAASIPTIERRIRTQRTRLSPPFLLTTLAALDMARAAGVLISGKDSLEDGHDPVIHLGLLSMAGESGEEAKRALAECLDSSALRTRQKALRSVERIQDTDLAAMVGERIDTETDWPTKLEMVGVAMRMSSLESAASVAARLRSSDFLLHLHAVSLLHWRLLENPVALKRMDSFSALTMIQDTRRRLYNYYLALGRFSERVAPDPGGRAGNSAPNGEPPLRAASLDGITAILSHAQDYVPVDEVNVLGRRLRRARRAELLAEDDLRVSDDGLMTMSRAARSRLAAKAVRSLSFFRESLLLMEWFVRETPFILNEGMRDVVSRIERCEEVTFIDVGRSDGPSPSPEIAFEAFYECTRQGIYITDVLFEHLLRFESSQWAAVIQRDLTHRRSLVGRGEILYHATEPFCKHLMFTTFAHDYRYGKESLDRPSLTYLWFRFLALSDRVERVFQTEGKWPAPPRHPELPVLVGPLVESMYEQHVREAHRVRGFLESAHRRCHQADVRLRVIPNLTYGLFCLAPITQDLLKRGIHVSLAGMSSRFCDDENINEFKTTDDMLYPIKHYLFSMASNHGTLHEDRVLIVVDGTMEPRDRHDTSKARLPKAYRGYVNHLAVVNYIRAKYGYGAETPEQEVASALGLPLLYVRNLLRTARARQLVRTLSPCFAAEELRESHARNETGNTYYSFGQWNPDGLPAMVGPIGHPRLELPCATPESLACPSLVLVSMNPLNRTSTVPGFFDNNPEVERPRVTIGAQGVQVDIGWPSEGLGVVASQEGSRTPVHTSKA